MVITSALFASSSPSHGSGSGSATGAALAMTAKMANARTAEEKRLRENIFCFRSMCGGPRSTLDFCMYG